VNSKDFEQKTYEVGLLLFRKAGSKSSCFVEEGEAAAKMT
jgi:hypothetical protein